MSSSLYSLAILGVLTSVVSCFYYIRLIKIMYFENNEVKLDAIDNKSAMIILGVMILSTIFFGVFLNWFLEITIGISSSI